MSNFNMPPGVNTNMIPGNRPEDIKEENFWMELDEQFIKKFGKDAEAWFNGDYTTSDMLREYVQIARDMAYSKGYQDGGRDEAMARNYEEENRCEHKWRDYEKIGIVCRDCGTEAPPEIAKSIKGEDE